MTPSQQADKWIKEMTDCGMSADQMLEVFRKARIKLAELREQNLRFDLGKLRSLTDQEILIAKSKLEKTNSHHNLKSHKHDTSF